MSKVEFVLISILLSGCGAGGGAVESRTGSLSPTAITISPSTPSTVAIGLTTNFTAQATYADNSTADITTQVTWATADATIATINNAGKATGLKTNSMTTVTASLGGISASPVTLSVNSKAITSISISTTTASVPKGRQTNFVATAVYSDSTSGIVTGSVAWSSDNASVTTMNSTGIASTLATGTANITASITIGTTVVTSNTVQLSVTASALATLNLTPSSTSISVLGTKRYIASGLLTDGSAATLGTLIWSSSNPAASISSTGVATGVSAGSSNISVSSGSIISNTSTLTVNTGSLMGGTVQGTPLSLSTAVTTFATGFVNPQGITTDGSNLYVANVNGFTIKKIVISSGVVTNLAGSGTNGSVDGTGAAATFQNPTGIATDGTNIYVADSGNNKIRKIVISSGVVTTLAGTGAAGSNDGAGTVATFNSPNGMTTDGINLYVGEYLNHRIRKIEIASGIVSTLAGSAIIGSTDGVGISATFSTPNALTTDGINLYVTDWAKNNIRKIVIATGAVTTLAGSAIAGSADGIGTAATFNMPWGITTDGTNLYVTEYNNNKIRKIVIATGAATTLAGSGTAGATDGTGSAASFFEPTGITSDGTNLFISDQANNKIRKLE